MKWGLKFALPTTHPTVPSTTRLSHRLSPDVTQACQGVVFKSVEVVKELMARTKTKLGLRVTVHVLDKVYQLGRKVSEWFKENMPIVFDDFLPQWNYRAIHQST